MKMGSHVRRAHPKPGQHYVDQRDREKPPAPFPAFVLTGDGNRITTRSSND